MPVIHLRTSGWLCAEDGSRDSHQYLFRIRNFTPEDDATSCRALFCHGEQFSFVLELLQLMFHINIPGQRMIVSTRRRRTFSPFFQDAHTVHDCLHVRFWKKIEGNDARSIHFPTCCVSVSLSCVTSLRGRASGGVLAVDSTGLIEEMR